MKNIKTIIIIFIAIILVIALGFIILKNSNRSVDNNSNIKNDISESKITNLNSEKILVVYFSETGNTEKLAKLISDEVSGGLVKIETIKAYPKNIQELSDYAQKKRKIMQDLNLRN